MVKIVIENGLWNYLELFSQSWLWKMKLYKGYINVLLCEIMHYNKLIMITFVMKTKENTRIILLYEKVQLNAYKRLFDKEYLISIYDINSYSSI